MTRSDTDTDAPASDADELPEHRCVDLRGEHTQAEIAERLGWSVSKVCNRGNDTIVTHDRVKTRRYYEEHPDASYREVSRQVDASNKTVTEWLKEDFDEDVRAELRDEVAAGTYTDETLAGADAGAGAGSSTVDDGVTAGDPPDR